MSIGATFRDAIRYPASPVESGVVGLPAIAPMAVASPESRRESAQGGVEPQPDAAGRWIGCGDGTGVVEIHDPRLLRPGHEAFCRALVDAAVARLGANRAEVRLETATCRLEFEPGRFDRTELARRVAEAVRVATPAVRDGSAHREDQTAGWTVLTAFATGAGRSISAEWAGSPDSVPESPARPRRLVDLAMAGGSFALAVGGAILPGIPTLPFLIMTGRYAVRVSPRIESLLRRQPWCASLLAEAEARSGAPLDWCSLSKTIGLAVLFAAAILILHPPLPVVLALELGVMAFLASRERERSGGCDLVPVAASGG
jgi:uncharacterized membrane protein YbaN (DUF454 family)